MFCWILFVVQFNRDHTKFHISNVGLQFVGLQF